MGGFFFAVGCTALAVGWIASSVKRDRAAWHDHQVEQFRLERERMRDVRERERLNTFSFMEEQAQRDAAVVEGNRRFLGCSPNLTVTERAMFEAQIAVILADYADPEVIETILRDRGSRWAR